MERFSASDHKQSRLDLNERLENDNPVKSFSVFSYWACGRVSFLVRRQDVLCMENWVVLFILFDTFWLVLVCCGASEDPRRSAASMTRSFTVTEIASLHSDAGREPLSEALVLGLHDSLHCTREVIGPFDNRVNKRVRRCSNFRGRRART